MGFQVSPGVNVSEIDLTTIIPAVSSTEGAIAGRFSWGPMSKRVLLDSENTLSQVFRGPDSDNYKDWFTAANFLAYGNALYVTRIDNSANNATAAGVSTVSVKSDDNYINDYSAGIPAAGDWAAKYPGALGNSLKVSVCQSAAAWESTLSANLTFAADSTTVTSSANLASVLVVGDLIQVANTSVNINNLKVASVSANGTTITLTTAPKSEDIGGANLVSDTNIKRRWEYFEFFDGAPSTSVFASTKGGSNDELHVAVVDVDGSWAAAAGTLIEKFANVSRANDAKSEDGSSIYYKERVNQTSAYLWWASHIDNMTNAGSVASTAFTNTDDTPTTITLSGGTDGETPSNANYIDAYNTFASAEDVDVSLILGGGANQVVATHLINNIAEERKDCLVVLSPLEANVVNNSLFPGAEAEDVVTFRNSLPSSSYATMDSNWKYQYDKYNDVFRFVPCNGDTAGLMVRTDTNRDPWFSPAGFNRGNIKNVVKLAFNPNKAERDVLYKSGVNPVVSFPGQGTILYGDKTLLAKPSAFDRINVRRLFIVLEKAIATASQYTLFEFNDTFTRAQFRNMVEPFLRDVQGRRGITDFRVVVDESNNTGEVIDRNEFIGDIYIKPARSINFIQLNFVAARTGVDFNEIVGQF